MTGETIKSFLVGLNFDVDGTSLSQFNKAIASASVKVLALGTAIEATATAIGYGITDISKNFEELGYQFHIIAPAINKALVLRRELLRAYSLAGVNITKVIQSSVKLNYSLAKTGFAFKAIYDSVGSRFFGLLTKQSDLFREKLYKNMPKIQNTLEHIIQFVFKAFEATTTLGLRLFEILGRVYDFFVQLDKATNGWSTIILGLVAAWNLLNLSFLATPLGLVLSLATALLTLYDDYRTFKEGGNSLFNWSSAIPVIDQMVKIITDLKNILSQVFQIIFAIGDAMVHLIQGDFAGFWFRVKLAAESVWEVFKGITNTLKDLIGLAKPLGDWAIKLFGNSNAASNIQNAPGGVPSVSPIGPSTHNQNNQTNQNVTLQSQTTIHGNPDASTLNQLSNTQQRNNATLVRNLGGSVRSVVPPAAPSN